MDYARGLAGFLRTGPAAALGTDECDILACSGSEPHDRSERDAATRGERDLVVDDSLIP